MRKYLSAQKKENVIIQQTLYKSDEIIANTPDHPQINSNYT